MLKSQVAGGMACLGNCIAILKLIYKMNRILSAEKPCNTTMKRSAKQRSYDVLCHKRASALTEELNDATEPLDIFSEAEGCVIDSYSRRSSG